MLMDTKVLNIETLEVYNKNLLPFYLRKDLTRQRLVTWLSMRTVTLTRTQIKLLLNLISFPQNQDQESLAWIAIMNRAITVEDSYWLNDTDCKYMWKDMNPLYHKRGETMLPVLMSKDIKDISFETVELTTKGSSDKGWFRHNNCFYLFKTKRWQQEVDASLCLDCLNIDHVTYKPYTYDGIEGCICSNMSNDKYSRVTAAEVRDSFDDYSEFIKFVVNIDPVGFYNMCVVDYLIANQDRHGENWGFYMNNETGELVKLHSLFDHNWAFGEVAMLKDIKSKIFPQKTLKEIAKSFRSKCNLKLIKEVPNYFYNNVDKSYFLRTCKELEITI